VVSCCCDPVVGGEADPCCTLADTLLAGNITGGTPIIISTGDGILGESTIPLVAPNGVFVGVQEVVTKGASLGGSAVFAAKNSPGAVDGATLEFRGLAAGSGISITTNANDLTIESTVVVPVAGNTVTGVSAAAGTPGADADFSREDHAHQAATGTPVGFVVGAANAAGASNNLVRSDHVHNVTVTTDQATATASFTRTANTDALITGMSLTLAAGTWVLHFDGDLEAPGGGSEFSIYEGGSQIAHTIRVGSASVLSVRGLHGHTQAIVTPGGSTTYEVRTRSLVNGQTTRWRARSFHGIKAA